MELSPQGIYLIFHSLSQVLQITALLRELVLWIFQVCIHLEELQHLHIAVLNAAIFHVGSVLILQQLLARSWCSAWFLPRPLCSRLVHLCVSCLPWWTSHLQKTRYFFTLYHIWDKRFVRLVEVSVRCKTKSKIRVRLRVWLWQSMTVAEWIGLHVHT